MTARRSLLVLGYLAIVLVVLRPPAGVLERSIVAGTEPCDTVPLSLAWTLGWGLSRIDAGGVGWWDAPIFHPTPGAFALSEPMPLFAIAAWPAHALGASLALCLALVVIATLLANGLVMRRWLASLRVGPGLATTGGALAILLPFVHQELGVLPLVATWPLVAMIHTTQRMLGACSVRGARRGAIELGLATAAAFACSGQLALLGVLALAPAAVCLLRARHRAPAFATAPLLSVAIGAAAILPLALPQRATLEELGLRRSDRSQDRGAARPLQLVRVPWPTLEPLPSAWVAKRAEARALDPGPLRVLAAVGGVALGLARTRRRREVAMLLVLVLAAIVLAIAPRIELGDWQPTQLLVEHLPGYAHIRAMFRVLVLAQLGVVALAMIGLRCLQVRLRARRRRGWPVMLAAAVLLVELVPAPPRWTELPRSDAAWVQWLRDDAEPGAAIALVPFAPSGDVCDHEATARAMVLGLAHRHPLVNGYSSFFPPLHNRTSTAARALPHGRGIVALRMVGTRYVVAPDGGPLDDVDEARRELLGITPMLRDDDAAVTIWAIAP